jgi:hypothetical protein
MAKESTRFRCTNVDTLPDPTIDMCLNGGTCNSTTLGDVCTCLDGWVRDYAFFHQDNVSLNFITRNDRRTLNNCDVAKSLPKRLLWEEQFPLVPKRLGCKARLV